MSWGWQGLKAAIKKQKYNRIMEKKMTTPTDLLCRSFPNEFDIFFNYTRALRFDDKPDYYFRKLFRDLFVHEGYQYDHIFDWSVQRVRRRTVVLALVATKQLLGGGKSSRMMRTTEQATGCKHNIPTRISCRY
jgi:hypothetical protein